MPILRSYRNLRMVLFIAPTQTFQSLPSSSSLIQGKRSNRCSEEEQEQRTSPYSHSGKTTVPLLRYLTSERGDLVVVEGLNATPHPAVYVTAHQHILWEDELNEVSSDELRTCSQMCCRQGKLGNLHIPMRGSEIR